MKERKYKNNYIETDRKTRVKMYKSGKRWVSSLISNIGLTKIFKGIADKNVVVDQEIFQKNDVEDDSLLDSKTEKLIKGAATVGTLAGGVFVTQGVVSADQVEKALELQTDQADILANAETVTLESTSSSDTTSVSNSTSISEETSTSESLSMSASASTSTSLSSSMSLSENMNSETSESKTTASSESEVTSSSGSESTSVSNVSESNTQSTSNENESTSTSESESLIENNSLSLNSAENDSTEISDTAEKTYEVGSDGWLYEVTTAADGTKNYRMTSILPRPEWDGMSFAELGITGSSFRSVTNGTKTTFTLNDFAGTELIWSGGQATFISTIKSIKAVYDPTAKTISWTVVYDASSVLTTKDWQKYGAYTGLWINTDQDPNLGSPTDVKIDGQNTRKVTKQEAVDVGAAGRGVSNEGAEYVSLNPSTSIRSHTFTFNTSFTGSVADLSNLKIGIVGGSATGRSALKNAASRMYETGNNMQSGRYSKNNNTLVKTKYVVSGGTATAVSGIYIGGIKDASVPKVTYSISGTVYEDTDKNGIRNAQEQAKSGVTVVLKNSKGNEIARTTTDANGGYVFTERGSGNYTITVIPPVGYTVVGNSYFNTSGNANVTVSDSNLTNIDVGLYNSASESTSISRSQSISGSLSASQSQSASNSLSTSRSQSVSRSLSTSQS